MPTRNTSLTDELDTFVEAMEAMVKSGKVRNASEAMRDAVRAVQRRWQEDALKLEVLSKPLQDGIDDLDCGRFAEIAIQDLDAAFNALVVGDRRGSSLIPPAAAIAAGRAPAAAPASPSARGCRD